MSSIEIILTYSNISHWAATNAGHLINVIIFFGKYYTVYDGFVEWNSVKLNNFVHLHS